MKSGLAAILGLIIGALTAASVVHFYCLREVRTHFRSTLGMVAGGQEYTCVISLAVLRKLEAGESEQAKLLLAREVARYYRHPLGQTEIQRQNCWIR